MQDPVTIPISSLVASPEAPGEIAAFLDRNLPEQGLFAGRTLPGSRASWRIGLEAFPLPRSAVDTLVELGPALLAFYRAANRLYLQARKGKAPEFVTRYLDSNKPDFLLRASAMGRFKNQLPFVLRPDILVGPKNWAITELDSVPGGIGLTACLAELYAARGADIIGGAEGMIHRFAEGMKAAMPNHGPELCAIVVSEESQDYRHEMTWLAERLCEIGLPCVPCAPEDLRFHSDAVWVPSGEGQEQQLGLVYRFFELFDWDNVDPDHLLLEAVRKRQVAMTPPIKPHLEEKALLALFHAPGLRAWWRSELSPDHHQLLLSMIPPTWVVDPTPLPPAASIDGLEIDGNPATSFDQLKELTQRQRNLILKVSGFSPLSWGAKGVVVGHDLPQEEWSQVLQQALDAHQTSPYVLQPFFHSRKFNVPFFDFEAQSERSMSGRVRLCPYYMVDEEQDQVHLTGALATICPDDKKLLHGMQDAVMVPCRLQ